MKLLSALVVIAAVGSVIANVLILSRVESVLAATQQPMQTDSAEQLQTHKPEYVGVQNTVSAPPVRKLTKKEVAAEITPVYGNQKARISIREFSDMDCGFCKRMHETLKAVVDHSQNVINWEYKHYPLKQHMPSAATKALAVECAASNYGNEAAWLVIDNFMRPDVPRHNSIDRTLNDLTAMGFDNDTMQSCMENEVAKVAVNQDYHDAKSIGVTTTPSVHLVDNKTGKSYLVKGYKTPEQMAWAIQQLLQKPG